MLHPLSWGLSFLIVPWAILAISGAAPTFVQDCISANNNGTSFDGLNLIQINCSSPADKREFLVAYNLNSGNSSDQSTPTVISNCQFNGCGNIRAVAPVLFQNVVFNHSSFGGILSAPQSGGGAVSILNVNAQFVNVSFVGCKARQVCHS